MRRFCEKCRDTVEYKVITVDKEKEIKGKMINYVGKEAYCKECKEEIFVPDIRDYNLNVLDDAYRDSENLIKVNEIEEILEKYDIGKRPLSLLLGWGEGTLSRYVNGDIPTKPYSDLLKRILMDGNYYREILVDNKEKVSESAFTKSINAINKTNIKSGSNNNKLESAIKYLLSKASEITPLALQKLLYYAQGFQKSFNNVFIFEEDCEAWAHGPVYREVYFKYKAFGYNPIEEKELIFEDINLTEAEKELLDYIVLYFGCYSGKTLEKMTHSEEPWRVARQGLRNDEHSDKVIKKSDIESYFKNVKEKYRMLNLRDIKDYSMDLFNKLSS